MMALRSVFLPCSWSLFFLPSVGEHKVRPYAVAPEFVFAFFAIDSLLTLPRPFWMGEVCRAEFVFANFVVIA